MSNWSTSKSILVGAVAVIALLVGSILWNRFAPSPYDEFAQCLDSKGAFVYEAYWCSNCMQQEEMFGSAYRHLDTKECSTRSGQNFDLCQEDGIVGTPTWENVNTGERRRGTQSLEDLGEWFGCELPE